MSDTLLRCRECDRTFARQEHLTRHLRRHTGAKPHACPQCGKSFSRRDTLKRHVSRHGDDAVAEFTLQNSRIRACTSCARAKQRCDGGRPCSTCHAKDRAAECAYAVGYTHAPSPRASPSQQPEVSSHINATSGFDVHPMDIAQDMSQDISFLDPALPSWDDFLMDPDFAPFWATMEVDQGTETMSSISASALEVQSIEEQDVLQAEDHRHVEPVPEETYNRILQSTGPDPSSAGRQRGECPPLACFTVYVQLYFEHFHPRMPFLHMPSFDVSVGNWTCLLPVACIGSQYSAHSRHTKHWLWLVGAVRQLLQTELSTVHHTNLLGHAQSLLAVYNCLLCGSSREDLFFPQMYRNSLIVHCRRFLPPSGSLFRGMSDVNTGLDSRSHWIQEEARRRLIYFMWVHECFQSVFYMLPPLFDASELRVPMPCSEALWQASTDQYWHELRRLESAQNVDAMDTPNVHSAIDQIARAKVPPPTRCESAAMIVPLTCFMQLNRIQNLVEVVDPIAAHEQILHGPPKSLHSLHARYEYVLTSMLHHAPPDASNASLNRTLQILLFVPLPLLHQATHWQTTTANHTEARVQLKTLLLANPGRSRNVLIQASRSFSTLRNAAPISFIDPFCLLVAVLYINTYIINALEVQTVGQNPSQVYRIDQDLDETKAQDWIEGRCEGTRLHVSGVGILDTERSGTRLFKEASRIFASSSSRSTLSAGLSKIMSTHAAGQLPEMNHPDEVSQPGLA